MVNGDVEGAPWQTRPKCTMADGDVEGASWQTGQRCTSANDCDVEGAPCWPTSTLAKEAEGAPWPTTTSARRAGAGAMPAPATPAGAGAMPGPNDGGPVAGASPAPARQAGASPAPTMRAGARERRQCQGVHPEWERAIESESDTGRRDLC